MPVQVSIRVDQRLTRQLRRLREKSIPFGIKAGTDEGGRVLVRLIQKEWNRVFDVRRRSFPTRVIKVNRARVSRGRVSRPTRVLNIAADELLSDQLRGGRRTPKNARKLLVPAKKGQRRSRSATTFVTDEGFLFEHRPRSETDRYVGVLKRSVKIPRRYSLRRPLARLTRLLPRLIDRALTKEIRAQEARR